METLQIDTIEQFAPHQDAWVNMLGRVNESSSIFLSPSWIFNWWNCFGQDERLCVLLAFEGDRMVGMSPLAVFTYHVCGIPIRILKFVGSGHSDHLDFCVADDFRKEVLGQFVDHLVHKIQWDVMDLIDVPDDSPNLPVLKELFEKYRMNFRVHHSIICPYLPLNGDNWDTFFAKKRSKSTRNDLKRRMRRLGELGEVSIRRYHDSDSVGDIFPQLIHVYETRWKDKNLSISFAGEKERIFYKNVTTDLALEGRLHLLTLELDRTIIAFTLSAILGTRFTWLITAFDPGFTRFFAGELVLTHLLQDVFERGQINEFDFTRGDEPYKFKWTDRQRWNLRILVQNKGLIKKVPFTAIRSYAALRREAKKSKTLRKVKLNVMGQMRRIVG